MSAIGLDVGHSAVKVSASNMFLFPAAAMPAVSLSVATADEAAKGETVRVNSKPYFVGDTAVIHSGGRVIDGLTDDWIATDEYHALMAGGFQKAIHQLGTTDVTVALGLPSRLHAKQKNPLRDSAAALLGLNRGNIIVLPQPMAAFYNHILNRDGGPSANFRDDDRWYVIDVGYYTTDFGCVDHTVWSASGQDSVPGTYTAAMALKREVSTSLGIEMSIRDAEVALRTRSVREQGEVINLTHMVDRVIQPLARSIIDSATQVFGSSKLRSASGIYVAGGGSQLLFDAILAAWKHSLCASNARFAVAEGLRRSAAAYAAVVA